MHRRVAIVAVGITLASTILFAAKTDSSRQRISFRTIKPMSAHFKSASELESTEKTLKQLGCDTSRAQHDGHTDLKYESKFWKSLSLKDAAEVKRWEAWLASKGFAVVHNTPAKDHKETVKYHLPEWKTLHFNQATAATAHLEMFKMLGCEVKTAKHNGHTDVQFRCPAWQIIGVPNHAEAHAWMGVLKRFGFATLHEH